MIKSIEIVCRPCHKCDLLKERIQNVIQCLEFKYRIRIRYEFKHTTDFREGDKYGYNITEWPLLIVNGNVEFAGHVKQEHLIRMKFEEIMKLDIENF